MGFFWIAASVADIAADNPNGNKILLARSVSTLFINDETAVINSLGKFENPFSWLVIFLVVPLNKSPLFFKDVITLIIFGRVFPEPLFDVNFLLSSFIPLLIWYSVAFSAYSGDAFFANVIPFFNPLLMLLFLLVILLVV